MRRLRIIACSSIIAHNRFARTPASWRDAYRSLQALDHSDQVSRLRPPGAGARPDSTSLEADARWFAGVLEQMVQSGSRLDTASQPLVSSSSSFPLLDRSRLGLFLVDE